MWFLAVLGMALAFHDHDLHVDLEYIEEESARMAWLTKNQLQDLVLAHQNTMDDIMYMWDKTFSKTDDPKAIGNDRRWEIELYPKFKKYYDRCMITHHVCQDLYGDDKCLFEDSKYAAFDDR